MNIGKMRHRVEVLKFIENKDSFGAEIGQWVPFKSVWADIQTKTGDEHMADRQVRQINTEITIDICPILLQKQVKYNETYEILAVINEDMKYTTKLYVKRLNNSRSYSAKQKS